MTTHDTAQATDVPRGFFSVDSQMLAVEIGHHAGMAFGGTPGPFHMTVEAMIDAAFKVRERKLESELAALRAKLTPGQSDRDFVETLFLNRTVGAEQVNLIDAAKDVAAHTAPIRAKLDQAVGLLRDLQNDMLGATGPITWSEDCELGKKGQPVDMHVAGDIRYRITERAKEKIDAFLATLSDCLEAENAH